MQNRRFSNYHQRSLEDRWLRASILTGPCQVGKTTLLEHLRQEGRHYVTLDDLALRALAREDITETLAGRVAVINLLG